MPTFFPDGRVLSGATGGGEDVCAINGTPLAALAGLRVSVPRPIDNERIVYSAGGHTCVLQLREPLTETNPMVVAPAANWLAAGGGYWAMRRQSTPPVYADSMGRLNDGPWRPLAASGPLGVLVTDYTSGGGLWAVRGEAVTELIPAGQPIPRADVDADGEGWCARLTDTSARIGVGRGPVRDVALPRSTELAYCHPFVVTWSHDHNSLVVVDIDRAMVAPVPGFLMAFLPAITRGGDGAVVIAAATTSGERPDSVYWDTFTPTDFAWRAIGTPAPGPTPVPPAPTPTPTPDPPAEEPTPMPQTMQMPEDVYATYVACVARFPHDGDDDQRREANRKAVATVRARHGERWVCKTEHATGWAAASKDAIAFVPEGPLQHEGTADMFIWDMIGGATRQPNGRGPSEERRAAIMLLPAPMDWLTHSPGPSPVPDPPGPSPSPTPLPPSDDVRAALARIEQKQDQILTALAQGAQLVLTLERKS